MNDAETELNTITARLVPTATLVSRLYKSESEGTKRNPPPIPTTAAMIPILKEITMEEISIIESSVPHRSDFHALKYLRYQVSLNRNKTRTEMNEMPGHSDKCRKALWPGISRGWRWNEVDNISLGSHDVHIPV
jgi:hypothetical protein